MTWFMHKKPLFLSVLSSVFLCSFLLLQPRIVHAATSSGPTDGYGIYESCTPWGTNDVNGCFARLDRISAGRFKLVLNYDVMWGDAAGIAAYLNRANTDGLKVIFAINDPAFWNSTDLRQRYSGLSLTCGCSDNISFIQYVINLVKTSPGLWGYYIGDEVSSSNHDQLKLFTDRVTQLDPSHPRLLVQSTEVAGGPGAPGVPIALNPFVDTADIAGVDYYPVGSWGYNESVDQTGPVAAAVQSVVNIQAGKQSAMVLQAHSWSQYPNQLWRCPPSTTTCPYPTLAEMQTMLSLTLANSQPRIVFWYSYFDILKSDNPVLRWSNVVAAIAPADTIAPSVPTGLTASAISSSQINLSWSASADNVGVTGYKIYRGGMRIATITGTSYQNTGLWAATTYSYTVAAYDAAGNVSALSSSASATTGKKRKRVAA